MLVVSLSSVANSRRMRGFTLIELMIAVAVIGILATIAFPSYTEYVRRSRIAEATGDLSAVRVRLEQYYQDNRNYGSTAAACSVPMPISGSGAFAYTCTWGATASNQSFLITATGVGAMVGFTFTMDNNNNRATTAFVGTAGLPMPCWITKRGGTC